MLVNYETTWYPSNHAAYALAKEEKALGEIRKVVVHDGHRGPKEIGVQPEFLAWLTDPEKNGAGALFDFGCYGANLMTWLMDDERPTSVTAVTQRFKPEIYPQGRRRGDDHPGVPGGAGDHPGVVELAVRPEGHGGLRPHRAGPDGRPRTACESAWRGSRRRNARRLPSRSPEDDFLRYFAAVVRGEIKPSGLSSLRNNLIVVEILDAARRSAATGSTVQPT